MGIAAPDKSLEIASQDQPLDRLANHSERRRELDPVDHFQVERIRNSIAQYGERFLGRVYTDRERAYASGKTNSAERFADRNFWRSWGLVIRSP